MLFPVKKLLEGREPPECVSKNTTVKDALARMLAKDYSQLPIVDEEGDLWGMISEATLTRYYYHSEAVSPLLDLTVEHCQAKPRTISPDDDIFNALDLLQNDFAVVVVDDNKPVGILTDYDTTHFFRDISGGLILIEDIEVTLRQYIETAFPTEHARDAALWRAYGQSKRNPERPAREYDELSLWEHVQLIITDDNWQKFEMVFRPKDLFKQLLEQVRDVRNQLVHFRGELDPVQHSALVCARDWLATRPRLGETPAEESPEIQVSETLKVSDQVVASQRPSRKYAPLAEFLAELQVNAVELSFERIESDLGVELPPSARQHHSWWANDHTSNVQSLAWLSAGWRVADVNLSSERVGFRRTVSVLQQLFFADLLERLKKARPGLTRATRTQPQSWWQFGAGKSGFHFTWAFREDGTLRVELDIDTESKERNIAAYDSLLDQKEEIECEVGASLGWARKDHRRASRVFLARPTSITDPPEELEDAKQWALETMLKFVDALQPRIREL